MKRKKKESLRKVKLMKKKKWKKKWNNQDLSQMKSHGDIMTPEAKPIVLKIF